MGFKKVKKKLLFIFPILLLIFFGLRRNSAPFFSVKECRMIQTGFLSDDYFSSIKISVQQLLDENCGAHSLIARLKNTFPILNKIVVAYRPCGIYVMTYAHKPLCCVNDEFVLTINNELFPQNAFAEHSLDSIVHITVAERCLSKVSTLIPSLLQELPTGFNDSYNLEVVNEHCVRLVDKQENNFSIMALAEQKNLSSLLAHCAKVKKNISERKDFSKGAAWIADVRFADYVVAYRT
jgi:hypothetical protein